MNNKEFAAKTRKAFNDLLMLERNMKAKSGTPEYYERQDELTSRIRAFLLDDFRTLNAAQLLKLCSMVSTYRPVQPHSFLVTCGLLQDRTNQGK